jgi:catechol 2,3-dioxygenase-like lactoylglutathione lyase family enzyme
MHITSMYHVNLNCRDFDVSLAFYQKLGFEIEMPFPEAGHPMVGKGLGVGEHWVKGALLRLGSDPGATRLDLLEWIRPRNQEPSPLKLTDPGIVRIALMTSDFESDYAALRQMDVDFISEPIYRPLEDGTQVPFFVCFRDPDGNVLELVQRSRPA